MGGNGSGRKPLDNPARNAALALMAQGLCTPADITALTGLDRVTAAHWATKAGIDWRKARAKRLAMLWRKELHNGARLVEEPAPATGAPSPHRGGG